MESTSSFSLSLNVQLTLTNFLKYAVDAVNHGCGPMGFIKLRYDIMGQMWPTGVWSTNEVRSDIFQEILDYITGKEKIPLHRPGQELKMTIRGAISDEYWDNYRDWLNQQRAIYLKQNHEQ